jgi:hypothetical protein
MQPDRGTAGKLLKAGFVLIVGVAGQRSPATAQSPGAFTATGTMTTARARHTATLLHSGKVLMAGGGAESNSWIGRPSNEVTMAVRCSGWTLTSQEFCSAGWAL